MTTLSLGTKIKIMRIARDMSQGELADRIGVRQPMLSEWERGKSQPCDGTLQRIKDALAWPPEDVAGVAWYILMWGKLPDEAQEKGAR